MTRWLRSQAECIRRGGRAVPPLDALLALATPVFRYGMARRLRAPRRRVEARVIAYGNLTAGGVGKTPAVIARAEAEAWAGRRVAVIARGYGSRNVPEPYIVAPGAAQPGLARETGDELALVARRVPEAVIVKAADRVAGARAAIAQCGCDTIILDDAFQHVALERDENVLVVDATNPFGNGCLLPRGILREAPEAMARATHVVLTHCDHVPDEALEALEARIRAYCPGAPIRRTRHAPAGLWNLADGREAPLEMLSGAQAAAVCAIGNPESFFNTLEALGAAITTRRVFPDHRTFSIRDIPEAGMVLTTEKDAVRLSGAPGNGWALAISLEAMP